MTIINPHRTHEYYTSTDRHWHAGTERYTGADSLLTALRNGWRLLELSFEKVVELRGGRSVRVIHFQLIRDSERILMPVVENPYVERLLHERKMLIRPLREAHIIPEKSHNNSPASAIVRA